MNGVVENIVKWLLRFNWGSIPDWFAAAVALYGLKIADRHFNKQPQVKVSIYYDRYQEKNKPKHYRFWAVNDGNVNVTVKWFGIRMSTSESPDKKGYQYTIGDDVSWHLLRPGEACEPIDVSVIRITQIINRWMKPGDTHYIDVAFIDGHNKLIERNKTKRVKITTTMVEDNSGLPKEANDGIPDFKSPFEIGVDKKDGQSQIVENKRGEANVECSDKQG